MSLLVRKPTNYHVTTHCFCCGKTRTDELHPDLAVGNVGRLREAFKARCVRNDQTLGEVGGVIRRAA